MVMCDRKLTVEAKTIYSYIAACIGEEGFMDSVLPHVHCHERKFQVIVHLLFSPDRESSEVQISPQESEPWFYIDLPFPVDWASLVIRKQIFDYFFSVVPIVDIVGTKESTVTEKDMLLEVLSE
jgi:hypothetical protein